MHTEWHNGDLRVTTDRAKLDVDAIHAYLSRSYWAEGIPRDVVERSLRHSLCFGLFDGAVQVGLARVVTDYATFAYLCDVFVLESHQGRGLGKWLLECVMAHPQLRELRRINLVTQNAHGLYRRFGFVPPAKPENYMELRWPDVYKTGGGSAEQSGNRAP